MARSLDTKRQSNNKNTNEAQPKESIMEDEFGEKSIQENIELNQQMSFNDKEEQTTNIQETEKTEELKELQLNKTDKETNKINKEIDKSKKEEPKFHEKKCFRCGQRKILNGVCQNCGERYGNLK